MLKQAIKLLGLGVLIGGYVLTSLLLRALTRDPRVCRKRLSANLSRWAKFGLMVFRMDLRSVNALDKSVFEKKNFLVVCNHLSYTDVIAIAASFPTVFVTSVEVRDSAFVGLMSALGGSVFVERRRRGDNIGGEISEITTALKDGLNVVIFPEGTSTNGAAVLPFKRTLLKSAIDAQVDVLPLVISYPQVNGHIATPEERDLLCYYGTKEFSDHLRGILNLRSFTVRLQYMPIVSIGPESDRKVVADVTHSQIAQAYALDLAQPVMN